MKSQALTLPAFHYKQGFDGRISEGVKWTLYFIIGEKLFSIFTRDMPRKKSLTGKNRFHIEKTDTQIVNTDG